MPAVGITVVANEAPPASGPPTATGTAFFVGRADAGSTSTALKLQSQSDFISSCAPWGRTATNSALYDAADAYFREGGNVLYVGRVVGATPVNASLALQDSAAATALTIAAATPGIAGNSINVVVTNASATTFTANTASSTALSNISSFANIGPGTPISGTGIPANTTIVSVNTAAATAVISNAATATATGVTMTPTSFTITLQDANGNLLATSGALVNTAAAVTWGASQSLVTVTQGASIKSPVALSATPLAGGTDDFGTATLSNWATALNLFLATLGPGQVAAPGRTNSLLAGIWSTLLTHAATYNRFALLDVDDNQTASTLIANTAAITTASNASYGYFQASSCQIPGITPGTIRTVAASAVIAGLCARVDQAGNPNRAAAGLSWPLLYVTGLTTTYVMADVISLNNAGINTFQNRFGTLENYGFSTPVPQTTDPIYWQAEHSRLRMALVAAAAAIGEPFLFAQLDGQGTTISGFGAAIAAMLDGYYRAGALYGPTPAQAYTVDVGPRVNTPASIAAGQLKAAASVRMSPHAQAVEIDLSAVPVTQPV